MSREEVNTLYKHASAMRKRLQTKEALRRPELGELVLKILETEAPSGRFLEQEHGTVVWAGPQTCRVRGSGAEWIAQLAGHRVAVGDSATIGLAEDRKTWMIASLGDRRTKLSRPDVGNEHLERVIVANVDIVCVVVSVVAPPLHPRLIDRYLIAIQRGGAEAMLCVNKVDLLELGSAAHGEAHPELQKLAPYRDLGLAVHFCSASSGEGIEGVRADLQGRITAFVGHSGVGKSSLMNAIFPSLNLNTGALMGGYGRGAHTTTASSLHVFPDETKLIDTPGVRSFGIGKMQPGELLWYFPEFDGFDCKFRDCSHDHEPGCGVREAAEGGQIHKVRYETYRRLLAGD